ncbi:ribonuclease HI [Candidatus Saccharibacteria bacterium]|nr:ribonuclease HI [Candidatus Saccharibacteria bacterium]MBR6961826.1 ribonuclease HI [Candidatus Saccharibacteria bacterium]
MKQFFTDGSASPNPGPGGYAVIDLDAKQPVALGKEANSTNIRMEAMALIAAYKIAEPGDKIMTDSEFWVNVVTKWAAGWKSNGWTKKSGPIKNLELVQELYELYLKNPDVILEWTRGHVGTEGNELADEWANKAREGATI